MSLDTTWTALGDPRPRAEPQRYDELVWDITEIQSLSVLSDPTPLSAITMSRTSRRTFGHLTNEVLAELLWQVAACKRSIDSPMGFPLEQRGVPSAGGIHPIHILVGDPRTRTLERYDGRSHTLQQLRASLPDDLVEACATLIPSQHAKILLFAAEPGKTAAKYEASDSLVWRDAGVLQGGLTLVAEGLGLNVCLLGMTGEPWVSQLSQQGKLRGVGMALVGSRL